MFVTGPSRATAVSSVSIQCLYQSVHFYDGSLIAMLPRRHLALLDLNILSCFGPNVRHSGHTLGSATQIGREARLAWTIEEDGRSVVEIVCL